MSLIEEIRLLTGIGGAELLRIAASAPVRYKVYSIPKRNGGLRIIAQPSRELKLLQRFLVDRVLSRYPVHESAAAYVSGKSIADNAMSHVNSSFVVKLDFQDYFHSILASDWRRFFAKNPGDIEQRFSGFLTNIFFWGQGGYQAKCLSIGAPSSPMLSNILMFEIDEKISEIARHGSVAYTRYADDITLSGETIDQVLKVEAELRKIVARSRSPKLAFNDVKRGVYTKGQRRMVTGLVLTPERKVSIGRGRKRMISALVHRYTLGALDADETAKLKGYLAFAVATEKTFVESMRTKYGTEVIDKILKTHIPKKSLKLQEST